MAFQNPSRLTEEEIALQRKYQKLKKKKKILQQLKTPKPEQPPPQPVRRISESGTDAKEVAKKLLKSGKIQAIKPPEKILKEKQDSGFKRSKAHERKRCTGTDKPGGYLPFTNHQHSTDDELQQSLSSESDDNIISKKPKPMYESFGMSRDPHSIAREEAIREKKRDGKANYVNRDNPLQGNTIYVHGENLSEDILRLGFSTFGPILNISAETSKNCGFITYDSIDTANMAINEMNGKTLNGIRLKVSLARRQPVYKPSRSKQSTSIDANDPQLSTSEAWSAIASNFSDSLDNPKKRDIVSYDDDDMYETV